MSTSASDRRFFPKRAVARRYGVTTRTVDRWKKQNVIPQPDLTINNRHFWCEDELDRHDRQLVAARGASAT